MTRVLRASEYGLLIVALPAALVIALWQSPGWSTFPDPSALLPASWQFPKIAWYALFLVVPCLFVCWAARRPAIVLGALVAITLSFIEVDAAASTWSSLVGGGGANAPTGRILLLGIVPIAVLIAAFAVGEDRRLREALSRKRLPEGAAKAALGGFRREALVAGTVALAAALALSLVMPLVAAPLAARSYRVVGLVLAAILLVGGIGFAIGWFSRRTPAGDA